MGDHKVYKRAYIRSSKSSYSKFSSDPINVMIGMYHPDGGTSGEFEIEFVSLGSNLAARLSVFEDSWATLWIFKDLLEKLAEVSGQEIQEPEFCELLDSLGIVDITKYEKGVLKNSL